MAKAGLQGVLVPRADAHQGEYVAPRDERLAWLTGFTGSAGFAAILHDTAGIFIDGRYTIQARQQVATEFTPVDWPRTSLADWLGEAAPSGARIGFDPWLHTVKQIEDLRGADAPGGLEFVEHANLIDAIWPDQPAAPAAPARAYPETLAGRTHAEKRREIAEALKKARQEAVVLTLPDSIAWLLNIRGADIPRIPIVHAFAILRADGNVTLFGNPAKFAALAAHFGDAVTIRPAEAFADSLTALTGTVRVDRATAPFAVARALEAGTAQVAWGTDPCQLPKACKTPSEVAGAEAAQARDAAAMVQFLHWFDAEVASLAQRPQPLTEIEVVRVLEERRRAGNALLDISFETIAGSGPNGALSHYRVTERSDRALQDGDLIVVDSGGQYESGTTDITRTLPVGLPGDDECAAFTRVLQGMIAISRLRFPKGLAGSHLDAIARVPLWMAGQDYDHGTGHGIGSYLSVHEGPQGLSRRSSEPLRPGMILSNEPGYYREGAFGIRIENLLVVEEAPPLEGADPQREMLAFRTLTYVPIDRRLIVAQRLAPAERDWIDAYHAETRARLQGQLPPEAEAWLARATAPL